MYVMQVYVWSKRVRTFACRYQKPMPFHLAILHYVVGCMHPCTYVFVCMQKHMHILFFEMAVGFLFLKKLF